MTVLMSAIFAIMSLGRGMQGCPVLAGYYSPYWDAWSR